MRQKNSLKDIKRKDQPYLTFKNITKTHGKKVKTLVQTQGSANNFLDGPDSKYFRAVGLCYKYGTLPLQCGSSCHQQYIKEWAKLCNKKAL